MRPMAIRLLLLALFAAPASANTPTTRLRLGSIWYATDYDGAGGWNSKVQYPAGLARDTNELPYQRGWLSHVRKDGTYLFATDWTDPYGRLFEDACSYMFRSMNYGYPTRYDSTRLDYAFPIDVWRYQRWASPVVMVDGRSATPAEPNEPLPYRDLPDHEGDGARPATHFAGVPLPSDPNPPFPPERLGGRLITEAATHEQWRYAQGVRCDRVTYGYADGTPHGGYVISEITLTNDGVIGDPYRDRAGVHISDQTLTGVLWSYALDYQQVYSPGLNGTQVGADTDGLYIEALAGTPYSAALVWDGDDPATPGRDFGDVSTDPQFGNLMIGNAFVLVGPLFVSAGPGKSFTSDLAGQPLAGAVMPEMAIDLADSPYAPRDMAEQRRFALDERYEPPLGTSFRDHPGTSSIGGSFRGPTLVQTFGPEQDVASPDPARSAGWTLAPGDSVRIVLVTAAGGIGESESRRIGGRWNKLRDAGAPPETWMASSDVALYRTGEDSALKASNLAYWAARGAFAPSVGADDLRRWGVENMVREKPAPHDAPYDVPDPPRPPAFVSVRQPSYAARLLGSQGVEILFTTEPESSPEDPDTGVPDLAGYRMLRKSDSRNSPWEVLRDGPPEAFPLREAVDDLPRGRVLMDSSARADRRYWYSVVAFDDGSQNWARPGASLESSRWWTYSGFDPGGISGAAPRSPVDAGIQVVPDPISLSSQSESGGADLGGLRVAFVNLPDSATVSVFDHSGRFITMFPCNEPVECVWNGFSATGVVIGAGVYIYTVESPDATVAIKRFTVMP